MKHLETETKRLERRIIGAIILGVFLLIAPVATLVTSTAKDTAEDTMTEEEIALITTETTEEQLSMTEALYGLIPEDEQVVPPVAVEEQQKGLEIIEKNKPKPSRIYTDLTQYKGIPDDAYEEMVRVCKKQISEQHLDDETLARKRQGEIYLAEKEAEKERQAAAASYSYDYSYSAPSTYYNVPDGGLTPSSGVNYYNGYQKETYYNLPMDGVVTMARQFGIEGEYWVREDGCKMLGDYIILATNRDVHPIGSIVDTSLGQGIAIDTGGFAYSDPYQVDVAVDW